MKSSNLEIAKEAAIAAGNFLKLRENIEIKELNGKDIKLSSDKNSEKIIFEILNKTNIPILSEETEFNDRNIDKFWIVDPLDGTVNYLRNVNELACVSIALWENDRPILGVVYRFDKNELYYASENNGAFLNDDPIRTSNVNKVNEAVLTTGFPVKRSYQPEVLSKFILEIQSFKKIRMLGAAAIMGCFVACGKFDSYIEDDIMLWDIASVLILVREAGGVCEITQKDDYKCLCRCFANEDLKGDYYAKVL